MTSLNLQKLHLVIRAVQSFRLYHQNCLIFEKTWARHNSGSSKILVAIIGQGQIFKSHQENCLISGKILPRDNRDSSIFQWYDQACLTFTKMPACDNTDRSNVQNHFIFAKTSEFKWIRKIYNIFAKVQLVTIGVFQIFKSLQQNCFIFEKISARDKTASSNFQITSPKPLYLWENFSAW